MIYLLTISYITSKNTKKEDIKTRKISIYNIKLQIEETFYKKIAEKVKANKIDIETYINNLSKNDIEKNN